MRPPPPTFVGLLALLLLTACNNQQATDPDPANLPPTVTLTPGDTTLQWPENTLELHAVAADDGLPNSPGTLSYSWEATSGVRLEGDGGATATATFPQAGVYTIAVRVSDGELEAEDSLEVTVQEAIPDPPGFRDIAWNDTGPNAPRGVTESQSAVLDGKLYLFGGYIGWTDTPPGVGNFASITDSYVFDPAGNEGRGTWEEIAPLPYRLTHAARATDGPNIYLAGGYIDQGTGFQEDEVVGITTVWRYNIDDDAWYDDLPELPEPRGSGTMVRVDRTLHFFTGTNPDREDKTDHWALDLDDPTGWVPRTPVPEARSHLAAEVVGGKVYLIGGRVGFHGFTYKGEPTRPTPHLDRVDVYDPVTDSWDEAAPLPLRRSHHYASTFVHDGRIVVIGGEKDYLQRVANVTVYDPIADTWEELSPLPEPRGAGVAGVVGDQVIFTTGYFSGPGNNFKTTTFRGSLVDD